MFLHTNDMVSKGMAQGLAQGREGCEEGRVIGLREGLTLALTLKFGEAGQVLVGQIEQIRIHLLCGATPDEIHLLMVEHISQSHNEV